MSEIEILIGGRSFQVACQQGEEHFLKSAASLLDTEAQALAGALGRVPEVRMLLMAGLMLADKTAGLEEELRQTQAKLNAAGNGAAAASEVVEKRVDVPVVPAELVAVLSKIADRAEGVASQIEDAAAG